MNYYDSLDDAFFDCLKIVWTSNIRASPRHLETREALGVSFLLNDPRARLILHPSRRWRFPLALGELCWHMRGATDLSTLVYYSSAWVEASADRSTIAGSCYGHRIFTPAKGGVNQWDKVKDELRRDPDSRRAVILLAADLRTFDLQAPDVPCATAAQFLVRDDKLHLILFMRSNDVILGLGYDCFLFTMLQERMAQELGLSLGWYQHIAGSLHLYNRHFNLAERILADPYKPSRTNSMPAMSDLDCIARFISYEEAVRLAPADDVPKPPDLAEYWYQLALVLFEYRLIKLSSGPGHDRLLKEAECQIRQPYLQLLQAVRRPAPSSGGEPA